MVIITLANNNNHTDDVMAVILMSLTNEKEAMLVNQTNPVWGELLSCDLFRLFR